jgi:putative aldouronate transport system permease protein
LRSEFPIEHEYKRVVQTFTYLPHFLSLVVVCGLVVSFLAKDGLIGRLLQTLGVPPKDYMTDAGSYRTIYVASGIWQQMGWDSILYLSALTAVDPQLYEACLIDGGGRLRQTWHVTLPGITPTIITLLVLRVGQLMSIGVEKSLLLYNPMTYETADIISTYVYRKGLLEANYSYAAAVGLFNSAINFVLLVLVNKICKRLTESSLW